MISLIRIFFYRELSWDDCYVDNENSAGFLNGKPGIIHFGFGGDTKCGNSMKCPIEAVVVSLSRHGYRLGEGYGQALCLLNANPSLYMFVDKKKECQKLSLLMC